MSVIPDVLTPDAGICRYCGVEMGPRRLTGGDTVIVRDCLRCGARWMNDTWLGPMFPVLPASSSYSV